MADTIAEQGAIRKGIEDALNGLTPSVLSYPGWVTSVISRYLRGEISYNGNKQTPTGRVIGYMLDNNLGVTTFDFLSGSLDSRITFTNSSDDRAYFDEFGVMRKSAANVARFDHNPVTGESLGLLIEEQSTNLLTYSEQLNGNWTPNPANSLSITADQGVAPDGTSTMDKVATGDTISNEHLAYSTFAGAPSTTYTFSMFLKKAELPLARMYFGNTAFSSTRKGAIFDLEAGSIAIVIDTATATMQHVGNGIYRCSITVTSDSDGGIYNCGFGPAPEGVSTLATYTSPGIGLGVYAWGAQLEVGAASSSYIKTEASQVTRAADSAVITGTNFSSWYNATEGTLYSDTVPTFLSSVNGISINDGTANERIRIAPTSLTEQGIVTDGGVDQVILDGGTPLANTATKLAIAYKANDFALSLNGGTVATDVSGTIPTVTQMQIGANVSSAGVLTIKKVAYYPRRLSDAQLQAITS